MFDTEDVVDPTLIPTDGEYNAEKELRNLYRDGWRIEEVIPGTKPGHPAVLVFVRE